jgi:hypothetical protein
MKKISVLIVFASLIFACSKSTSPNNPDPLPVTEDSTGLVIKSLLVYPDSGYYKSSFQYDASGNLISLSDTTVQHNPYQILESQKYFFNYNTTSNLITSYRVLWRKFYYDSADNVEEHLMFYDDQNRLTEDSMTSINGINPKPSLVSRIVYEDNLSVMNMSTWGIDSLTIISGDVAREGFYEIYNGVVNTNYINNFTSNGNFINPFYN